MLFHGECWRRSTVVPVSEACAMRESNVMLELGFTACLQICKASLSESCCTMQLHSLSNVVVIIIGASSGIGLSTALLLARSGCKVLATAPSDDAQPNVPDSLIRYLQAATLDLAAPSSIDEFIAHHETWIAECEVLALNAAIVPTSYARSDAWSEMLEREVEVSAAVNLHGPLRLLRMALPLFGNLWRIGLTSSFAHRIASQEGALAVAKGTSSNRDYFCSLRAYAESKLAMLSAMYALFDEEDASMNLSRSVELVCFDPNIVNTSLNATVVKNAFANKAMIVQKIITSTGFVRSQSVAAKGLEHMLRAPVDVHRQCGYVFLGGHSLNSLAYLAPSSNANISLGKEIWHTCTCRSEWKATIKSRAGVGDEDHGNEG
jgi:NAD(P)-dependent dehydrogenase (short-subunit alcohol dehydrogenase family)